MIRPINGHVLIEPVEYKGFMATEKQKYQEIGVVKEIATDLLNEWQNHRSGHPVTHGDKVLFDAWLGKKYPKEGSNTDYYWLIKYTDIVAYEVPEQSV